MNSNESFLIYKSFYGPISRLSNEQLGRLFRAIFEYQINGTEDVDDDIQMAFGFFKNQFWIDEQKYQVKVEKLKNNANKRWQKQRFGNPLAANAIASNCMQTMQKDANNAYNVNVNDNANDNAKENANANAKVNDNEGIAHPASSSFVVPTSDDLHAFCVSKNIVINEAAFMEHYELSGWTDRNGKPVSNWKQAALRWYRNETKPRPGKGKTDRVDIPKGSDDFKTTL